jgi:hypothetical protein
MLRIIFKKQERGDKQTKIAELEIERFDNNLLDYMTKWFEVQYCEIKILIIS